MLSYKSWKFYFKCLYRIIFKSAEIFDISFPEGITNPLILYKVIYQASCHNRLALEQDQKRMREFYSILYCDEYVDSTETERRF